MESQFSKEWDRHRNNPLAFDNILTEPLLTAKTDVVIKLCLAQMLDDIKFSVDTGRGLNHYTCTVHLKGVCLGVTNGSFFGIVKSRAKSYLKDWREKQLQQLLFAQVTWEEQPLDLLTYMAPLWAAIFRSAHTVANARQEAVKFRIACMCKDLLSNYHKMCMDAALRCRKGVPNTYDTLMREYHTAVVEHLAPLHPRINDYLNWYYLRNEYASLRDAKGYEYYQKMYVEE